MKKICIPQISISHHGGTKILIDLANYLCLKNDVEVSFLIPKGYMNTNYFIDSRIKIEEVSCIFKSKILVYSVFLTKIIFLMRKYDTLIANFFVTFYPIVIAVKLFNKEYFYFVQDIENKYKSYFKGSILNFFCNITYKSSKIISANSYLSKLLYEKGISPFFNTNIGLDKLFFEVEQNRKERVYDIIYFARHEPWKGLDEFIILAKDINAKFLIVSQDEQLILSLKQSLASIISNVTFAKPTTRLELINLYDKSKIFISTSKKEGFSLPPLEAMARGVIPVVYPSGGPEIYGVDKENIFFYKDYFELVEYTTMILKDTCLFQYVVEAALTSCKSYVLERSLEEMSCIILLNNRS